MKRQNLIIISIMMILGIFLAFQAQAANPVTVQLQLTIYNSAVLSISNTGGDPLTMGTVIAARTNAITSPGHDKRVIIQNKGNVAIDLRLSASSGTLGIVTGTPAADQVRLFGLFKEWQQEVDKTQIGTGTEDVIETTAKTSSATAFAYNTDSDGDKGFNVNPLAEKSLKFLVQPGTATTQGVVRTITLTVTAIEH